MKLNNTLKLLCVGLCALCALCASALKSTAQDSFGFNPVVTGAVYVTTTTNLATPQAFFVGDRRNVDLSITVTGTTGGWTNQAFFARSDDGILYDTNSAKLFSISNVVASTAGTLGPMKSIYSFDSLGDGYWELISFTEGNLNTTNTIKRTIKKQAP